jgi:hypothetical protein
MKLMMRIFLAVWIFASCAFAQADKSQIDAFKKEALPLQGAIDGAVNSVMVGFTGVLEHAKATYVDGYGVVVSLETSLVPGYTPFNSPRSPSEIKADVNQRKKAVQEKLESLLKDQVAKLQCLGEADSLTIAVHFFNANPGALPTFPSQLQLTVKKQDPTHVIPREF